MIEGEVVYVCAHCGARKKHFNHCPLTKTKSTQKSTKNFFEPQREPEIEIDETVPASTTEDNATEESWAPLRDVVERDWVERRKKQYEKETFMTYKTPCPYKNPGILNKRTNPMLYLSGGITVYVLSPYEQLPHLMPNGKLIECPRCRAW